jgi:hypothetical protein
MPSSPPNDGEFRSVPVTRELRDRLRVAKAEEGLSYDEYLRENLSLTE